MTEWEETWNSVYDKMRSMDMDAWQAAECATSATIESPRTEAFWTKRSVREFYGLSMNR